MHNLGGGVDSRRGGVDDLEAVYHDLVWVLQGGQVNMEEEFLNLGLDIIGLGVFNYKFGSITTESPVIQVPSSQGKRSNPAMSRVKPSWSVPSDRCVPLLDWCAPSLDGSVCETDHLHNACCHRRLCVTSASPGDVCRRAGRGHSYLMK